MLTYNGTAIEHVNFNGTAIESGTFNGVTIFEEGQENTVVLRTQKQRIKLTVKTKKGSDVEVWNAGEKVAVLKSDKEGEVLLKDTGKNVTIKGRDINTLSCNYNQLTSLNVQGLSTLQFLDCTRNQLTSLNLQGCTALQRLVCYYNELTSLNLQGLSALKSLNICGNRLTADVFKDMFIHITKTKESGRAILYRNYDYNYKDFTQPAELASAFNAAKAKGWKFYKNDSSERNLL